MKQVRGQVLTRVLYIMRDPVFSGKKKEVKNESADKPGSVVDSHSSRASITTSLKRPTRTRHGPCLSGSLFGLAPSGVFHRRRVLPPTRCALTAPFQPYRSRLRRERHLGGILSVALSVGSRRPDVIWHFALWSPDFPPPQQAEAATAWQTRRRFYHSYP